MDVDKIVHDILPQIQKRGPRGVYVSDIRQNWTDSDFQLALLWLAWKRLIHASYWEENSDDGGAIHHATITSEGIDYIKNGFSFAPLPVQITLDEQQLEHILIVLTEKFGSKEELSALQRFLKDAKNAGINALATHLVQSISAYIAVRCPFP